MSGHDQSNQSRVATPFHDTDSGRWILIEYPATSDLTIHEFASRDAAQAWKTSADHGALLGELDDPHAGALVRILRDIATALEHKPHPDPAERQLLRNLHATLIHWDHPPT